MSPPDRCAELKELVWLAIDGELDAGEQRTLDRHLAECAACRARVESSRRIAAGLRQLPAPAAPAGFKDATLARVDGVTGGGKVIRAPWRWQASAAAAAALVVLATWWGLRQRQAEPPAGQRGLEQVASAPKSEIAPAPEGPVARDDEMLGGLEARSAADSKADEKLPPESAEEGERLRGELEKELKVAGDELEDAAPREEAGMEGAREADAGESKKAKLADEWAEKRRDANGAAGRVEEQPIELAVREADSPAAALRVVLGRVESARARKDLAAKSEAPPAPVDRLQKADGENQDDRFRDDVAQDHDAQVDSASKDKSTRQAAARPPVDFLDVAADAAADSPDAFVRSWLKARGAIAEESGVAVLDVTPAERDELLAALERRKGQAQPKDARAWLEQVTDAAPARKPGSTGANKQAGETESRGQPPAAPAAEAPSTASARKGAEQAPPRVRVVLWLGPPRK